MREKTCMEIAGISTQALSSLYLQLGCYIDKNIYEALINLMSRPLKIED